MPRFGWTRRSELPFLLGVTALQAIVVAGPMGLNAAFVNDTLGSYGLFYDHLDSLHRFGEPAWWAPHLDFGTPTYFFGLLNIPNLGKPAFVLMGLVAFSLGRLGIPLPSVSPFYVFYFGVLIPFLLMLGVWFVAREVLRSRAAVRYVLAVAAFSPPILLGLSDPGVTENAAYGAMCAAAYLRFIADPTRTRFWMLCAASLLVSIAVSSTVMVSAVPMLAMLVGSTLLVSPRARKALRSVRLVDALAAVALLAATAAPSAIAYSQLHDHVINRELGTLRYSFGELKAGNPLQFLLVSVPGVEFDWDSYRQPAAGPLSQYRVVWGASAGVHYMGVLALSLAATGLVFGRRRVRAPLFVMLVLAGGVVVLFASSPVLAPLLLTLPVLGTINHFGDQFFQGCGFLVLLFAAGLGMEAAERNRSALRWLSLVFVGSSAVSLSLFLGRADPPAALGGFVAFLAACMATLLAGVYRAPARSRSRLLANGLIALTLLDLATVSFWYVRPLLHGATVVSERGLGVEIGSSDLDVNLASRMFPLRTIRQLENAGVEIDRLPYVAGFCAAHASDDLAAAWRGASGPRPEPSLGVPVALRDAPALAPFFFSSRTDCRIEVGEVANSYDSISVSVDAARTALIVIRDAFAPGWTALVNGSPVEVFSVLGGLKMVVVPAGASRVMLRFSPPFVGEALAGSYAVLLAVGFGALWATRRAAPISAAR